jgi:hypothetical protein
MFERLRSRRAPHALPAVPQPGEAERDSGEEEYESREEDDCEVEPSGLTRIKTHKI